MKRFGLVWMTVAMAMGCSRGGPSSGTSDLVASQAARAFGVAAYALTADGVSLRNEEGRELGHFTVEVPDAARRLIRFDLATGEGDEIEVYRPVDGAFHSPISAEDVYGAVLTDAALAELLTGFSIEFVALSSEHAARGELGPAALAYCNPANAAAGCTNPSQLPCTTTSDYYYYTNVTTWNEDQTSALQACYQTCSGSVHSFTGSGGSV